MITSSNNAKVKQVVQWQTKAKERRKDHVFLAEGVRMCEEAPVKSVREVYLTEELEQKLRRNAQNGDTAFWDKLQQTGYETGGICKNGRYPDSPGDPHRVGAAFL